MRPAVTSTKFLTARITRLFVGLFLFSFFSFLFSSSASAAESDERMTLTLAPPVITVNLVPGDVWKSAIKVVNGNTYDVTLNAHVEDFRPNGESGTPVFAERPKGTPVDPRVFSSWITLASERASVKAGATADVPFTISIPADAEPGGHYAAILVGIEPQGQQGGVGMSVGSYLTSLLLLRVGGDVVEEGAIRDFYADQWFLPAAHKANFTLRFENKGNVHVIPQGDITLYNMWGKERGRLALNSSSDFGNVLPGTTRKFSFAWEGEPHPFDIGRYKAVATLAYGADGRKSAFRTAYFWVVPWKEILMVIIGIAALVWFIARSVRRYVERVVALERGRLAIARVADGGRIAGEKTPHPQPGLLLGKGAEATPPLTISAFARPLRAATPSPVGGADVNTPVAPARSDRRIFALALFALALGSTALCWYFVEVLREERSYQMVITKDDGRQVPIMR